MESSRLIRPMRESDLENVIRIERQAFPKPWPPESFGIFDDERSWVICEGDSLRGFIMSHIVLDEATIMNLAIDPLFWRQGLATQLLEHTIEMLTSKGVKKIFLEVRLSNLAAKKLYQKHSFKPLGLRKDYYQDPREDALVLVRYENG